MSYGGYPLFIHWNQVEQLAVTNNMDAEDLRIHLYMGGWTILGDPHMEEEVKLDGNAEAAPGESSTGAGQRQDPSS